MADVQAVEKSQQQTPASRQQAAPETLAGERGALQAALDTRAETQATVGLRRALDASPRVGQQASLAASVQRQPSAHPSGLPAALAAGVERLSGVSLSGVRVHYNSSEPAAIQARAFTQGAQIHVAPGEEATLPHEAWHAAQQAQGRVAPTLQAHGLPINDDARLEHEADVMGARAARLGATASEASPAPPPAAPRAAGSAQAPVQGVWVTVRGQTKKIQARTLEIKDGVQLYSHGGKFYVRVSGSSSTNDLVVKQVKSQRKNVRDTRPSGRSKEERREALQVVRTKRRAQRRFVQPQVDTGPRFSALEPVQQEQVLALGRYLSQRAAALFEDGLAARLKQQNGIAYRDVANALARQNTEQTPPDVSRRDQSNEFDLDIAEANKLFGGSITTTDKDALIGGLSSEQAFDDDGLLPESQYAESARTNRNRVVSGLDNRIAPVLRDLPERNRQFGRLMAFAVLHEDTGASLFEVFQSTSELLGPGAPGVQIYRAVPQSELASFGWSVYPDWFEGPTLLNYLASALHGGRPTWPAVVVPDGIRELVSTQVEALAQAGVVQRDDSGGQVPRVLWDEVSSEDRSAIRDVADEEDYEQLKGRFQSEGNPPAFVALVLLRGSDFGDTRTDWHESLAQALLPPETRTGGLDAPQVKTASVNTLKRNANDVADYLGDYDYGTSIGDKREDVLRLIDDDPGGAYGINKYIAGGFGSASDTLDQPWSKEGDQSARVSIHGTVRGLEKLPVREGWSYRREESANQHVPGEIISPGVLWSSALAPQFASQFDRKGQGTLYAIHSRYTARDVQLLAGTLKWYQREVLFPPYARFVVEDKLDDERYGTVYTLRELPPQGPSLEVGDVLDEIGLRRLSEDKEVRTLVDKGHYDVALAKYLRQEAWTTQEAEGAHIEGLTGGIHHPRALYGSETFRRWRETLRWQPSRTEQDALWTVDGFLALASRVSGQPERLRDGWSGWGEGDDTFALSPSAANNATALGLRVGRYYGRNEFTSGWKRALGGLPDRDYRDGDFKLVRKNAWGKSLVRELNAEGSVWLWRGDVPALLQVGALKPEGGSSQYTVKYGLGSTRDVDAALRRLLADAQRHLDGLNALSPDYAENVTKAAARLQQEIVAIHPLSNANGRVSRLYMYKVLQKYLPMFGGHDALPVLPDTGKDLTTSRDDWGNQLWNLVRPTI